MGYQWSLIVVTVAVACAFFVSRNTVGAQDLTPKTRICNGEVYPRHQFFFEDEKDYECAVNGIVRSILSETPQRDFHRFYSRQNCYGSSKFAYGYGFCTRALLPPECSTCINEANSRLFEECSHSVGAQVELQDCQIRYENYPFLGTA